MAYEWLLNYDPTTATQDPSALEVTHVVADAAKVDRLPPQVLSECKGVRHPPPVLLSSDWVSGCIAQQRRLPEGPFTIAGVESMGVPMQLWRGVKRQQLNLNGICMAMHSL